jgi:hypothetical protein
MIDLVLGHWLLYCTIDRDSPHIPKLLGTVIQDFGSAV